MAVRGPEMVDRVSFYKKKVDNRKNGKKKIIMEIVATSVLARQPPERQPTAMPTFRSNIWQIQPCVLLQFPQQGKVR